MTEFFSKTTTNITSSLLQLTILNIEKNMAATKVFESFDLVENILTKIDDIPYIAGARYISKVFNEVGKSVYEKKHTAKSSEVKDYLFTIHNNVQKYIIDTGLIADRYNISTVREYNIQMLSMLHVLHDIYVIDWTSYLHMDMDQFWKDLLIVDKGVSSFYRFPNCVETCKDFVGGEFLGDILSLLHVYNADIFTVAELKRIARMKGIPNCSGMKRSKLVKLLTHPEDDIYVYDPIESEE